MSELSCHKLSFNVFAEGRSVGRTLDKRSGSWKFLLFKWRTRDCKEARRTRTFFVCHPKSSSNEPECRNRPHWLLAVGAEPIKLKRPRIWFKTLPLDNKFVLLCNLKAFMAETIFHSVFRVDAENKNFPKHLCFGKLFPFWARWGRDGDASITGPPWHLKCKQAEI